MPYVNMNSFQDARRTLDTPARKAWLRMIYDGRFKYILSEGYRPMLFDLQQDSDEFHDLGDDPAFADVRARLPVCSAPPSPMAPSRQLPFRNVSLNPAS